MLPKLSFSKKYLILKKLKMQNGYQITHVKKGKKKLNVLKKEEKNKREEKGSSHTYFTFKCVLKYLHSQVASQSQCLS